MYVAKETGTERSLCIENVLEDIVGGGIIEPDDFKTTTTVMGEGALVGAGADGIYHLVKTAKIHENAASNATAFKVKKAHEFLVGDVIIASVITGCKAMAITSIDTAQTDYDTLNIGTALGLAVTTADCLIQADAVNGTAGAAAYKYTPAGLALNAVDLTLDNKGCGIMCRGTVNESLLPYYVDSNVRNKLPLVRFV